MMERILQLPLHLLEQNPSQPRYVFDKEMLEELSSSIREMGILQPPIVRKEEGGSWQIVSGHRRVAAAKIAGLATIPVLVRHCSEKESAELALIENIQREDLNPIEIALGYQKLVKHFGLTQEQVAQVIGNKRSSVSNALRILSLPSSIQENIAEGKLSLGHAKAILSLPSKAKQEKFAREILAKGLSVRQAEKRARQEASCSTTGKQDKDRHIKAFTDKLEEALGTVVSIRELKGKGTVSIKFYSYEDLQRLAAIFGVVEE